LMFFTHFIRQAILRFIRILLANLAVPPWHMKYIMDLFSVAKFMMNRVKRSVKEDRNKNFKGIYHENQSN
jgi:hypothetical protein